MRVRVFRIVGFALVLSVVHGQAPSAQGAEPSAAEKSLPPERAPVTAPGRAETSSRTTADRHFAFARGLYQQGLFELAAGEFDKFAEQFPQEPRREAAVFYAAQSLFQSGKEQRETALTALLKYQQEYSASQSPFFHTSFYLVGEIHLQKAEQAMAPGTTGGEGALPEEVRKAYDDALTAYLRCKELSPGASEVAAAALSRAGYCGSRLGNWEQAVGAYQNLADSYQSVRAQFMVGETFYHWGQAKPEKLSDAIRAYKKVAFFGDNALEDDAALGIAWSLYKQAKFDECRRYLEEQINRGLFSRVDRDFKQKTSKLPEAYYLLGLCSSELGDNADAVKSFRFLIKYPECPLRSDGLARLGELLGGNVDRTADEGAEISYAVGQGFMEAGKPSQAAEEFERLYNSYPRMATAPFKDHLLCDWGVCYEQLACYREALAILSYLSRRSSDTAVRARAARVEAICHRELALEANNPIAKNSEELDAIAALKRYADNSLAPRAEETLGNVGDFYYSREMYAMAAAVYEDLLSRFPKSGRRPDILFRLGRCYLDPGHAQAAGTSSFANPRKAIACFEQCRREYPSSMQAVFATEQLAALFAGLSEYERALVEYSRLQPENFPTLSEKEREACKRVFEDAAYAQGIIREKMADVGGAVSELELFILQFPTSQKVGRARLRLAELYLDEGRYEDSIRVLRPYFAEPQECPDLETALATATQSFLELDRASDAIARMTEVFNSPAGAALPPTAFARLSRIMEKGGEARGARLPYSILIEQKTKFYNAMDVAAANTREMVERREYAKAVDYCSDIFAIHAPEKASDWKEKKANLEKAAQQTALASLGAIEEMKTRARSILRAAFWELGELNLRLGDAAGAAKAFESLAGIKPPTKQHFDVLFRAGSAWKEAGELQRALQDFDEIVRSSSEPADRLRAQLAVGNLWLDSGDASKSLGTYLRIINFYDAENPAVRPWVAEALFQSGVAFEKLRRMDDARRQFEALLRDFGSEEAFGTLVEDAKRRLSQIEGGTGTASAPSS